MPAEILHLLGTAELEGSGIARIVAALAAGLDPHKYHVNVWFLGPPGPLAQDLRSAGATVHQMNWSRGARDPVGAWRFWRCLRANNFAIVHQHEGARSVRHIIRHSSKARLVVHLHGDIVETHHAGDVPIAARGADAVIAVSHAVARQLPSVKPVVVYAGAPLSPPSAVKPRAKGRPPSSKAVIGAACRLVPLKGLSYLIRAVALLRPEFPTVRLEIAGAGPERTALEREAQQLGLEDHVHFLGWQRDLSVVWPRWDIFVLPSLEEGFGMSVLEAMGAELPVVATSVGGLPELIEDGYTGYIVPRSDVAALAERLGHLIRDPEHRCAMGAAGWKRARDHFSVDRMVSEIEAIYDALLTSRSPEDGQ